MPFAGVAATPRFWRRRGGPECGEVTPDLTTPSAPLVEWGYWLVSRPPLLLQGGDCGPLDIVLLDIVLYAKPSHCAM
jgi:hypothetical protein